MKQIAVLLLIIISIIGCGSTTNQEPKPYEGTWLELTKTDEGYIVYNYPSLWDDGETINPRSITIRNDSLIRVTFSDDVGRYSLKEVNVEKCEDGSYLFPVGNYYRFTWVDREKYIACWTIYYGNEPTLRKMSDYLYIDNRFNSYPVIDFEWDFNMPIIGADD
jgi:hypothetical protein